MNKTFKNDAKAYRNGVVFGLSAAIGLGHIGANGLRKIGVSDTDSLKEAALKGYAAPQRGLDYLLSSDVRELTDAEMKECEATARGIADATGNDYDVILSGLIESKLAS